VEFAFSDHLLDVARRELRRGAELIAVQPQVFDLLVYLVQNRDRVVSKDDLLAAVWGGRIVSESTLTSRVTAARGAVGDDGETQSLIRTLPRKGFRFVGVVTENRSPAALPRPLVALPDKPSIAVLPFQNLSGDHEQEYFADGLVEEIIAGLSCISWLVVIARNSSFAYKGQIVDVKQVGRELGVRYVLEGSVRKAGGRVRIAAQLIDAASGAHLWADRFDGRVEDSFELQEKVAASVAGAIEPALQTAEMRRSAECPVSGLTAYDLYLRAYALHLTSETMVLETLGLLERAIALDPCYGPALGLAAVCSMRRCLDDWSENPLADRCEAADLARRALRAARDDPDTLVSAAVALAYSGEDIGSMMALVDRALRLNPSFARGWYISGGLSCWAGQPDRGIRHAEVSLRLSPRVRIGGTLNVIGGAHFLSRRFAEAVPNLRLAIQDDPDFPEAYRHLAACLAHMGQLDEARETVRRLLRDNAPHGSKLHTPPRPGASRAAAGGAAPGISRDDMSQGGGL
jgi:TolB-like protein